MHVSSVFNIPEIISLSFQLVFQYAIIAMAHENGNTKMFSFVKNVEDTLKGQFTQ